MPVLVATLLLPDRLMMVSVAVAFAFVAPYLCRVGYILGRIDLDIDTLRGGGTARRRRTAATRVGREGRTRGVVTLFNGRIAQRYR